MNARSYFHPLARTAGAMRLLALMVLMAIAGCGEKAEKDAKPQAAGTGRQGTVSLADADAGAPGSGLTYVGKDSCIECHAEQADKWKGSYHDLAMDHATGQTVLGDFNNVTFTHFKTTSRFFKKDGRFFANTDGPPEVKGALGDYEIKYVFGVFPLQQYLVEFPGGRLQSLPLAWDVKGKKWFHLYPGEPIPHADVLHWTKPLQNWNYMCASCHSTNLRKNFDPDGNVYRTRFSEMNVSCEACHGPGSEHVKWAKQSGYKGGEYFGDATDFKIANYMKGASWQELETCAPCHARRHVVYPDHHAGARFLDHYGVEMLEDRLYHPDGQILDEVYEYGSFLQSKMYQHGVKCSQCHDPHSTKLVATGNALCVRCHDQTKYDTKAHHHHNAGWAESAKPAVERPVEGQVSNGKSAGNDNSAIKEGATGRDQRVPEGGPPQASAHPTSVSPGTPVAATCIDCHMPRKNYMVVDPRRDHSFRIPRPDLTVMLGVPNACAACHADKPAEWARDQVVAWYGPKRPNDPHYGPAFAAARAGKPGADADLIAIADDLKRPGIVRATALQHLGDYGGPMALGAVTRGLKDADALVRVAAIRALDHFAADNLAELLTPLMTDSLRAVRVEAARVFSKVAMDRLTDAAGKAPSAGAAAFRAAIEEFRKGQMENADQAGAYLNLAVVHERLGENARAEQAYHKAIERDAAFVPARMNLAMLLARQGKNGEAEKQLLAAIDAWPDQAEPHYSLGLLLGENPARLKEAAAHLGKAAALAKTNPRMFYNHGLALQRLNRVDEAEAALKSAYQLDLASGAGAAAAAAEYANALMVLHLQRQQWIKALPYARRLAELFPNDPQLRAQFDAIRQRAQEQ